MIILAISFMMQCIEQVVYYWLEGLAFEEIMGLLHMCKFTSVSKESQ